MTGRQILGWSILIPFMVGIVYVFYEDFRLGGWHFVLSMLACGVAAVLLGIAFKLISSKK